MNKLVKCLTLIVFVLYIFSTGSANASNDDSIVVFVKVDNLNLRASPSLDSLVLAKLSKGQRILGISVRDRWIKVVVYIEGRTLVGWVDITFVSTTPVTPPGKIISYKEFLGDESMQGFALRMLRIIIEDGQFLHSMLPEDHLKALMAFKHKPDRVGVSSDNFKPPSKTYLESGDCEDLTIYTVAWGVLANKNIGIIWFSPESVDTSDKSPQLHVAAVLKYRGNIMVVDCSLQSDDYKVLTLDDYFEELNLDKYTRYRIWWIWRTNSEQEGIKRVPKY